MIRETTADVIRRRRGMKPMDEVNDELQPRVVQVDLTQPPPQPDVEEAAQALAEHDRARPGSIPAQVGQAVTNQTPQPPAMQSPVDNRDVNELAAAQDADRDARNAARMRLATRQFISGMTHTPIGEDGPATPSQAPQAQAAAKTRAERAAEVLRLKRQGIQDDRTAKEDASQAELRNAQIAHLLRAKKGGADSAAELATAKATFTKLYPEHKDVIAGAPSMKVLQDLQNALDAEKGRGTTIEAARIAANATRGFAKENIDVTRADAEKKRGEDLTKDFANEMKGRGVMKKRMSELVATIPKTGAVPGTGVLGDAVAWFDSKAGTDFQSPEAIKVRQNIGLLMAAILREQSGATVSEQEYARAVQNGLSTKNAATTRAALKRLEEEFAISESEIRRKYPKDVIRAYETRAAEEAPKVPRIMIDPKTGERFEVE